RAQRCVDAGRRPGRLPLPRLGSHRGGLRPVAAARPPPPGAAPGRARVVAAGAGADAHRREQRGADLRQPGVGAGAVTSPPRAVEGRRAMAHESPKRIRNVALVGHRGSGKTSVNEALLFTAGAVNRLGSVADGTTVSDSASDEKARE